MANNGLHLAALLAFFAAFAGIVVNSWITGVFPTRGGPIKRRERPRAFRRAIIASSAFAIAVFGAAILVLVRIIHH